VEGEWVVVRIEGEWVRVRVEGKWVRRVIGELLIDLGLVLGKKETKTQVRIPP
jgi:hypothetical protein